MPVTQNTQTIGGDDVAVSEMTGMSDANIFDYLTFAKNMAVDVAPPSGVTALATALASYRVTGRNFTQSSETTVTLADGDVIYLDLDTLDGAGTGKINFHAAETAVGSASDITEQTATVTLTSGSVTVGQYAVIAGTIGHDDYTPARQTDARVVGRVLSVSGSDFELDRAIPYNLTAVTVATIPDCRLYLSGTLKDIPIDIENVPNVEINATFKGGSDNDGVPLDIHTAASVNGKVHFDNYICLIGVALNYVSGGRLTVTQESTCGNNVGSKVCRGNAVHNMEVIYKGSNARYKDFGFEGARDCVFRIKSVRGGAAMFETGDTSANRLESVVIAESQGIAVHADIEEANDQALEFIACQNVDVYGRVANSKNTTSDEGAMIIKGESSDIRVHGKIDGYNSRGVKVECSLEAKRIKFLPTCEVTSSSNVALHVRDATSSYDADIEVQGVFRGVTCIEIKRYIENCKVDATVDMRNATTAGLTIQAPCKSFTVRAINTDTNKKLADANTYCTSYTIGESKGDTDGCYIQLNGDSRNAFSFDVVNGASCNIRFGATTAFVYKGGVPYADSEPAYGTYSAGDIVQWAADNQPGDGTTQIGIKHDGTAWQPLFSLQAGTLGALLTRLDSAETRLDTLESA